MSPLPVSYMPLDAGAATSSPEEEEVSVCTVAATAVATGHLMLKLEGYSRLKGTHRENGSYIESSVSKVGGHTWKIRCYLNGNSKENAGFVSLYLNLCSDSVVLAEFEFALVRQQGTPPAYGHQGSPSKTSQGVRTFGGKDNYCRWGLPRFISVEELERSMFLRDDCLAVRCTVTLVRERTVKEKVVQAHDLARLGMLCKCDDHLCKRHHARPAETFWGRFAKLCHYICRGSVYRAR
ncbi:unnamed protein product [Miscanthus lutarioriparius]|uniref:MATH domain-containing protein n=1 Tax=Miscanthus lutarioriparius TaxID=422564 RepID=A0A811SJ84_9POAL|nr:unnamed protein product [Miscanthus lutarioriparius]